MDTPAKQKKRKDTSTSRSAKSTHDELERHPRNRGLCGDAVIVRISPLFHSTTLSNFILQNWISFPRMLMLNCSIRETQMQQPYQWHSAYIDPQTQSVHNRILRSVVVAIRNTFSSECFGIRMSSTRITHNLRKDGTKRSARHKMYQS